MTAVAPARVGTVFLKLASGEVLARAVAFGATVYLARTLGASTYGVVVLATTVMLYLAVIADGGVEALGVRDVAAAPGRLEDLVRSTLGGRFLIAMALVLVTAVGGLLLLPQPEGAIVAALSFAALPLSLNTRWAHLGLDQPAVAATARVLTELVTAAVVVITVRGPADVVAIPLAQVLGEGAGAFLLLHLLRAGTARAAVALSTASTRALLARSWPLIGHALLGLAIFNSDFIVLRAFRDATAVGTYAVAYTLISFFLNLGAAYTMSLLPAITQRRDDLPATRTLHDRCTVQVLAGAIPVAAGGFVVAASLVELIFGTGYADATVAFRILVWSIPLAVIRNVGQALLIAHDRNHQLLASVAWAAATNLLLGLALIPAWGIAGAAIATLVTEALRTALVAGRVAALGVPVTSVRRILPLVAAGLIMVGGVLAAGQRHVAVLVLLGGVTYALALPLVGAVRVRRGTWPELVA